MFAEVEELPDSRVRLTVEVPGHDVKHAVEHAASDLAGTVKIPGFRKGKVPLQVLISRIGRERLLSEAVQSHISGWFWNAAARTRIRPVEQPSYDYELPANTDEPWEFAATVAVQEKPELPDWTSLEVPAREPEVPEEAVVQALEQLQATAAELTPVDDRAAQSGDVVVVDLVLDGDARRDYVVELGGGRLAPEVERELVGRSVGATADVALASGERDDAAIGVTLKEIHGKVLPPLDDELARRVSEFDTLDDLRSSVEDDIREQVAAAFEDEFRAAAVDALVRAARVEADGPLVEARTRELLTSLARSLERRGLSLDAYIAAAGRSADELIGTLRDEARQSVARELALEAVADRAQISVGDGEVDELVREQAPEEDDAHAMIAELRESGTYEQLRADLRLRRALDRLAADVKRIPAELAEARESIWTPEKDKPETAATLWTPGSKESV